MSEIQLIKHVIKVFFVGNMRNEANVIVTQQFKLFLINVIVQNVPNKSAMLNL